MKKYADAFNHETIIVTAVCTDSDTPPCNRQMNESLLTNCWMNVRDEGQYIWHVGGGVVFSRERKHSLSRRAPACHEHTATE